MLYAKAHQRFCFTVFMVSLLSSSASSTCTEIIKVNKTTANRLICPAVRPAKSKSFLASA
jgi:hypothetical protein